MRTLCGTDTYSTTQNNNFMHVYGCTTVVRVRVVYIQYVYVYTYSRATCTCTDLCPVWAKHVNEYEQTSHAVINSTMRPLIPVRASRACCAGATWKLQAVSGSMNRICAAAPAWKFSESRAVLSAYEMGAPAMRFPMSDTSATEMWPMMRRFQ